MPNKNTIGFICLLMWLLKGSVFGQNTGNCDDVTDKKAMKLYNQAYDNFINKKLPEASQQFRQVLEMDSACGKCFFFLGLINFHRVDYNLKAATKYFEKSIELCPDFDVYVYYYLGDIYSGAEKWDLAIKYLTQFLKDPEKIDSQNDQTRAEGLLKAAKDNYQIFSNPVPFDPHYVKGVSSAADEIIPSMSPDGSLMFYARVIQLPPAKNGLTNTVVYKEKFFYSDKINGEYTNGQQMPYPFNVNDNEGGASVTINNNELYYSIYKMGNTYDNGDIYYSKKDDDGFWSEVVPVENVNNPDSWESMPCISSDGNTLYFVSDRPGGYGGYDIYASSRDNNGLWGTPKNLGPNINTKGNEKTPFIHTDSQTLYFSSDSPDLQGLGGYDIYFSRKQANGSWSKAQNLGYPINSSADDAGFFVSIDGKTGYFSSNKLKGVGGWDVYSFELYKEARPEEMKILKGSVKEETTEKPVEARIELKNVETKKITQIPVDFTTGNYAIAISTKNDYILTVKKTDYAYESKLIPAEDTTHAEPVSQIDFAVKPIAVGQSYRLNDIYFGSNSFELNVDSKAILDGFIEFLNENPNIKIAIHGHTDNIGNDQANLALSEERSKSVYNYLIEHGMGDQRLSYKGFGKTKPIATNDTEAGRAKNRRTEFVILEK
ncbi:MAG: OmpA family protein [Bacteroidota bacterium]